MLKRHDPRLIHDLAKVPSNFHVGSEVWVMCSLILSYSGSTLLISYLISLLSVMFVQKRLQEKARTVSCMGRLLDCISQF